MAEDPGTNSPVRLAFRIGYIGTSFSGSQFQPDKRTVEGEIEAALMRAGVIVDRKKSRLALSGRTDRGVHAKSQILAISTTKPDLALRSLNGQLPPDIWATHWSRVSSDFYPRYDVESRTYRFYYAKKPSDIRAMKEAAPLFLGTHDFTCFARLEPGKNPIKSIDRISLEIEQSWCRMEITANSYLWHMVRCIASALFCISEGMLTISQLEKCLSGRCRQKMKPAQPDGLILWAVNTNLTWQEMIMPGLKSRQIRERGEYYRLLGEVHSLLFPEIIKDPAQPY
ncbi:MAG: tRNA pseudouridine(38-40) synthase TruA [Methanomicrobiales archaeon]|nr:tRNA pseudouridine(38-40) synthase TruA [Methanomicrobiales archaeon]